jgi:hypothetical protein
MPIEKNTVEVGLLWGFDQKRRMGRRLLLADLGASSGTIEMSSAIRMCRLVFAVVIRRVLP